MTSIDPQPAGAQSLVDRVKDIFLKPGETWDRIRDEPATIQGLYVGYICILAAIPAICGLIGGTVFGHGAFGIVVRIPIVTAVVGAIFGYLMSLAAVFILGLVIDGLAPSFGGEKNRIQAFKVAAYSWTAGWVAGIFTIFPPLGILAVLGAIYGLYLLYLGLPKLMKAPEDKALTYTVVVIVVAIVVNIVIGIVTASILAATGAGTGLMMGGLARNNPTVSGTVHIPGGGAIDLGKLEAASKSMEAASKGQTQGVIKPVAADVLKGMLPASLAGGYTRGDVSAASGGAAGMSGSNAQANYAKGDSTIQVEITDLAAAGAFAGMASAFNVESSKETATGYEKVGKVNGRMTTEEYDRSSKHGKYGVLVADRFMVEADGSNVTIDDLKGAVAAVGPDRLEGMAKS